MASHALHSWKHELADRLDELEAVHATATGTGPGRRWGTDQFNGQLFVALVGQFQAFARNLHDEALDWLRQGTLVAQQLAVLAARQRRLDKVNPSPGALAEDFGRLGMKFPVAIKGRQHGARRLVRLERAVALRNGIAHADVGQVAAAAAPPKNDRAISTLNSYRKHRRAFNGLAEDMDAVVAQHLGLLTVQTPPW